MFERLKETIHKYKKWEPAVFFVAGFCFDALLLHRIDDPLMLVHQAIYLTLSALIIAWDLFAEAGKVNAAIAHPWLAKIWQYREGILHFMLGTLLNVYAIFYFKSGSFVSSLSFLLLLALLLFLNEARPMQIPKHSLRNALWGLCLISYFNILVSIVVGSIGTLVFLIAVALAYLVHSLFVRYLNKRMQGEGVWRNIRLPFLSIAAIYLALYFFKVLPPVPLSVKYIGIYHSVEKSEGEYKLGFNRARWRFWQNGDQSFAAKPGEKIYCFVQVFSPARFEEKLFVRWHHKDPKFGWQAWDAIPLSVSGGREAGFRGYTAKSNYVPGEWEVAVETSDGREVGTIDVDIVAAEPGDTSEMRYDVR